MFLVSNSPDEMWCSKKEEFFTLFGFQGVSDCVCQLTMGKCNS